MNPLLKFILIIISLLICNQSLYGQSDQLERDIRIAERILEEIFTPEPATGERQIVLPTTRRVESEYIPGVGVHFKVAQSGARTISIVAGARGAESNQTVRTETNESVENRMMEYFTQYAGQLRGLPDNEQVRITFGARTSGPRMIFYSHSGERQAEQPRLTMWVDKADIDRFSRGTISEDQFKSKLSKHEIFDSQEMRDLNIFASILETAINRTESKYLKVNRKPAYEYLPGLGAHFHVNISGRAGFLNFPGLDSLAFRIDNLDLGNVDVQIDLGDINHRLRAPHIEFNRDSLRIAIRGLGDSLRVHSNELRGQVEMIREQAEAAQRQGQEIQRQIAFSFAERDTIDLTEDATKLMAELKTAIKDYGPTLSSLGDNELLMITVNWSGRNPSLPERTHIRISKSDLMRGAEPNVEEIRRR